MIYQKDEFEWIVIGNRTIIVKGIAKMFYQDGIPIGICVNQLVNRGYEVSWLHIADQCLKNGWSSRTVIKKLREEAYDSGCDYNPEIIEHFCNIDYESQREMIFEYLFRCTWHDVRSNQNIEPLNLLRNS